MVYFIEFQVDWHLEVHGSRSAQCEGGPVFSLFNLFKYRLIYSFALVMCFLHRSFLHVLWDFRFSFLPLLLLYLLLPFLFGHSVPWVLLLITKLDFNLLGLITAALFPHFIFRRLPACKRGRKLITLLTDFLRTARALLLRTFLALSYFEFLFFFVFLFLTTLFKGH